MPRDYRGPWKTTGSTSEPDETLTLDDFKRAMGAFVTGVTVVTTSDPDGRQHGLTANSFTSVSLDPPLVLFCLAHRAPSLPGFRTNGHFAINVLSAEQEHLSGRFARPSQDKFEGLTYERGLLGDPLLDGCIAHIECETERRYEGGDHEIFVGRARRVQVGDGPPLIYHRSQYLK